MKKIMTSLVGLMLLLVSGCSVISTGYNNADVYFRYSIYGYTSFSDTQKLFIRNEVDNYLLWHRRNMLPEYADFLRDMLLLVQSGSALKSEDVVRFRLAGRALYVKTLQPMVKPAASLLNELDNAQLDELVLSFAKENNKYRNKYLSGSQDEKLRKRAEKTIDFIEQLVGGLTDGQLEAIKGLSYKLPYASDLYFRIREKNQAGLIGLSGNNKGEAGISAFLVEWLMLPETGKSAEELGLLLSFERGADDMVIGVYAMLDEQQKKTLVKNISKYIDAFTQLAGGS